MTAGLRPGDELAPHALTVDDAVVAAYAQVARDWNPIHFDDAAARALGFSGRIAHGMISGALVSRMLTAALGVEWLERGHLQLRFVAPLAVGAGVHARGTVRQSRPLLIDIRAETDDGTAVLVGTATLTDA